MFSVPSPDGSEVFFFDETGKHTYTRDALTGAIRYDFSYDADGRLTSIRDVDGGTTTIKRNATTGVPDTIVAPLGQKTPLTVDANGYLKTIKNPAGEVVTLTTDALGLLTGLQDPSGEDNTYTYDAAEGRLKKAEDPAGGSQTLTKETGLNKVAVTRKTEEGHETLYETFTFYDGQRQSITTDPAGLKTERTTGSNGVNGLGDA